MRLERRIKELTKQKEVNRLALEQKKLVGGLPTEELEKIARYESHLNRQFSKTLAELERLQRMRTGENIPAPTQVFVQTEFES